MPGFELLTRAVIIDNGRLLLCRARGKDHYYLPGGHVEFGESAAVALDRELQEELGVTLKKADFIGVTENIYEQGATRHHEINLVFETTVQGPIGESLEDHISFAWKAVNELSETVIMPPQLKKLVGEWLVSKQRFWGSDI